MFYKTSVKEESETREFQKDSSNLKLRSYGPRVKGWRSVEAGRMEAEGSKETPLPRNGIQKFLEGPVL